MRSRTPRTQAFAVAAVAVLTAGALVAHAADAVPIADRLLAVRHQRECRLTTSGRRSGKPHAVTVWFAVDGDVLYLSTLDDTRDWVKNALAKPTVTMAFDELTVTGRFRDVTGTEIEPRAVAALRAKYWIARVAGWFGRAPARTFVVEDVAVAPAGR